MSNCLSYIVPMFYGYSFIQTNLTSPFDGLFIYLFIYLFRSVFLEMLLIFMTMILAVVQQQLTMTGGK